MVNICAIHFQIGLGLQMLAVGDVNERAAVIL